MSVRLTSLPTSLQYLRLLHTLLLKLHKAGEISENTYKEIRPVGSVRPRMYGTAKVHKDNVPLRPILAMIDSPQHATAKWLAKLLEPVSTKFSKYVVKDSFEFSETVRQFHAPDSVHMCSYDIKSWSLVPLSPRGR